MVARRVDGRWAYFCNSCGKQCSYGSAGHCRICYLAIQRVAHEKEAERRGPFYIKRRWTEGGDAWFHVTVFLDKPFRYNDGSTSIRLESIPDSSQEDPLELLIQQESFGRLVERLKSQGIDVSKYL